ncbi:protein croquemort [Megachile rotundata]|uniref:protein croquemort n=1 Tax=Megachile rotundata TaxID=143995 RepID=UPI000258F4C4|nr:PREDICTED: protein croquemort-like [Megachile rotundata]XP_012152838.1 PREDICTED: protein croquemort-like [Megachile rotundata]
MKIWTKLIIIFIIGIVITAIGLTGGLLWSSVYSSVLFKELSLTPESTNYKLWTKTPIPMYLKIYMFNLTNAENFGVIKGEKPNFVEMGPYVFSEVDTKVQETWNKNGTITYQRKRVWRFEESMSNGSLSDNVTNINAVTASVVYALRYKMEFFKEMADRIMRMVDQKLVVTKTVNELLFEGYNDTMLNIARKLNVTEIPFTKFGWFVDRNGTASYDGTFNMLTGESDLHNLGMLTEWNFKNRVSYYPGECGVVKGTNGDLWPPLTDNETISFFVSDICTSLTARYNNTVVHEGLTGVRYTSDDTLLDNGSKVPSRRCYCEGDCVPSGALNISLCKWGAPAFISLPHFYLADPSYRENITGMIPDREKHELSIALEPKTGVPLKVNAQLQLNLLLLHDDVMSMFKNVTNTFVPMLWFTQEARLTSDYASIIKFILILRTLGSVTLIGIAAIGVLIISIGVFLFIRHSLRGEENQTLLSNNANSESSIING